MATITRGATVLTPRVILPASLVRPGRSVVHEVIGTPDVDLTVRAPGPRAGEVRAIWPTEAAAAAAAAALGTAGGAWTFADAPALGADMVAYVVGDVVIEALTDWGGTWQVTVGVQEVTA